MMLIAFNQKMVQGASRKWNERKMMENIIESEIEEIIQDLSGNSSNCDTDGICKRLNAKYDAGFEFISDSGKLDINFVPEGLLQGNEIRQFFTENEFDDFMALWKSVSLVSSIDIFKETCPVDRLNELFYLGNRINCNFVDFTKLSIVLDELGVGENKCSSIITELKKLQKSKKGIKNDYELRILFGIYYDNIKNFITYRPIMDINLADEKVLIAVLEYLDLPHASNTVEKIVAARMNKRLSEKDFGKFFGSKDIDFMKCIFASKPQSYIMEIHGRWNCPEIVFVDDGEGNINSGGIYWK